MTPKRGQTPSQTVGPFFSIRLGADADAVLPTPPGSERIVIEGQVLDGDGEHVGDALIETWQANPSGRYNHPDDGRDLDIDEGFTGFARAKTDFETGVYLSLIHI